jgi:hypothetical protein
MCTAAHRKPNTNTWRRTIPCASLGQRKIEAGAPRTSGVISNMEGLPLVNRETATTACGDPFAYFKMLMGKVYESGIFRPDLVCEGASQMEKLWTPDRQARKIQPRKEIFTSASLRPRLCASSPHSSKDLPTTS